MSFIPMSNVIADHHYDYFKGELSKFHLSDEDVFDTMSVTSMVLGGGFATNMFLHTTGRNFPGAYDDIDFFVYGGIKPNKADFADYNDYHAQNHKEGAFYTMVLAQFKSLVEPAGYVELPQDADYGQENSEEGDRIFTTGSDVKLDICAFGRYENDILVNKLNLVFSDTPIPTLMRKVDISLTAGFIYTAAGRQLTCEHCYTEDINQLRLRWTQEGVHTPRQLARWQKYKDRYHILDERTMTVEQFVTEFDALPDAIHITLVGAASQLASSPITRRMAGLPHSRFTMRITHPIITIPQIHDPWNELPRDPGTPRNQILSSSDYTSDDETVVSQILQAADDAISTISHVSDHYYYQEC